MDIGGKRVIAPPSSCKNRPRKDDGEFLNSLLKITIMISGGSRIFLRECTNSQSGCANLLFCNFFAENCMRMKEFGTGGHTFLVPPKIRH